MVENANSPSDANQLDQLNSHTDESESPVSEKTHSTSSIRKHPLPKSILLILLGVGIIAAGIFGYRRWRASMDNTHHAVAPSPMAVQLQTLQSASLQDNTEYVGTLEAEKTVELKPQIQGQIQQILVKPGVQVKQGEPIFILNPDQTIAEYKSNQAAVAAAVAAQNTAAQQLQSAESQLASTQAQYELAKINNKRNQYLVGQGAIAQNDADQAATDLKVKADAVKSAQNQIKANKASVVQAEANVKKALADAAAAEVDVNFKRVVAPISGAVGDISLKVGDYVTTGQTLTTINQNDFFDLQIPIPISRSGELRQGLAVQLLDPNTSKQLGSGSIYFVSSQVNADAQSILTRARFSNASRNLRNSQYVKARVIWDIKPGVLVPINAVTTIGDQNFVFVAQENQAKEQKSQLIAHQVPVKLGNIQGQNYQVLSGLKPGDKLVVSGTLVLRDGIPIVPLTSSSPRSTGTNTSSQSSHRR